MRVLAVVLALVAIPFVAGVSQAPYQDPKNCGTHLTPAEKASARVSRVSAVLVHGGKHGVMDRPCGSTETPPPVSDTLPPPPAPEPEPDPVPSACQVTAQGTTGWTVDGKVSDYTDLWAPVPLKGWCIQLSGAVTATVMTRDDGTYQFTGLTDGAYTVCEVLLSGYTQIYPTLAWGATQCANGTLGWTFTLEGFSGSFVDFRNVVARP
jgi:hypothetical protein